MGAGGETWTYHILLDWGFHSLTDEQARRLWDLIESTIARRVGVKIINELSPETYKKLQNGTHATDVDYWTRLLSMDAPNNQLDLRKQLNDMAKIMMRLRVDIQQNFTQDGRN